MRVRVKVSKWVWQLFICFVICQQCTLMLSHTPSETFYRAVIEHTHIHTKECVCANKVVLSWAKQQTAETRATAKIYLTTITTTTTGHAFRLANLKWYGNRKKRAKCCIHFSPWCDMIAWVCLTTLSFFCLYVICTHLHYLLNNWAGKKSRKKNPLLLFFKKNKSPTYTHTKLAFSLSLSFGVCLHRTRVVAISNQFVLREFSLVRPLAFCLLLYSFFSLLQIFSAVW